MKPYFPVDERFGPEAHIAFQGEGGRLPALPAYDDAGTVVTRWRAGFWERLRILFRGDVFVSVRTGFRQFQPVALDTRAPAVLAGALPKGGAR